MEAHADVRPVKTALDVLRDLIDEYHPSKFTLVDERHQVAAARIKVDGRWFLVEVRGEP